MQESSGLTRRQSTRTCRGGRITTISHTSRISLSSCRSADLRPDGMPHVRRRSSLSCGLEKKGAVGPSTAASDPTLASVHLRSKQLSDPWTSQSLQADMEAPRPDARSRLSCCMGAGQTVPPAQMVHTTRQRSHPSPDCVQDSVSLPLVPRGHLHPVQAPVPTPPQQQGAAADSDPFLDETSNSRCTQYTTSSSQLPAYADVQVWADRAPDDRAGDALCAPHGVFCGYGGATHAPPQQNNAPTHLPWADELSTYSPTCRGAGTLSSGPRSRGGGQPHACTCCALAAGAGDMHPACACASVQTSRSVSSSPTRPRRAFLGGCEIRGTLSRALAEIGGQSSGSFALDNGSGNGSNGLACVAGGAGVIGTSFLGYPFDTWRSTDIEGVSEQTNAHTSPALSALLLRRASVGSAVMRASESEQVPREPYLGTFRLPAREGAAVMPPSTCRECVHA